MASLDIGIDLGTSTMVAGSVKNGISVREPSIVAMDSASKKVIGIGKKVESLIGRERGNIEVHHPLEGGVICNYSQTLVLTKYLFKKAGKSIIFKPRVIACVPCGATGLEAQSLIDTIMEAGARSVMLMQEPVAAAFGANIDITLPMGNLIVDIGGGTTDAAVLSLGGVVSSVSSRIAGKTIDEAIQRYVREEHSLIIGMNTAEKVKKEIASLWRGSPPASTEVKGRGVVTGLPTKIILHRSSLYSPLNEVSLQIIQTVQQSLEQSPPELVGDIFSTGICLTGGSALLTGIKEMLEENIRVPVHIPENPSDCAILGTLDSFSYWGKDFSGFYSPRPILY